MPHRSCEVWNPAHMTNDTWEPVPTRSRASQAPPNDKRERLLYETMLKMFDRDETNHIDEETQEMLEQLPWDQLELLNERLGTKP